MRPIAFNRITHPNGDVIHFIYDEKELFTFHQYGQKAGTSGAMLVCLDLAPPVVMRYHSYGTLENPCTTLMSMYMIWNVAFEGAVPEDNEDIIKRFITPPSELDIENFSFVMIDVSEKDSTV